MGVSQEQTPPPPRWMLKAQGSWEVSPAAISHLPQRFMLPLGCPALGDMWLPHPRLPGDSREMGCPSTHPQARGRWQAPA